MWRGMSEGPQSDRQGPRAALCAAAGCRKVSLMICSQANYCCHICFAPLWVAVCIASPCPIITEPLSFATPSASPRPGRSP